MKAKMKKIKTLSRKSKGCVTTYNFSDNFTKAVYTKEDK
jgi:hypothetical protein|tara:strand:+ start:2505 stop:2621 length:117 start_codon:yes stop_codon:yes gene_type:complete